MMKNKFLYKTVILSGLLMVFSCTQDAIFYKVSTETIPEKPRIPGAPTNMVIFERKYPDPTDGTKTKSVPIMYVASGGLHWYAKTGKGTGASGWDSDEYNIPQPGGKIIGLAVTDKHLYALSVSDSGVDTRLRRIGPDRNDWEEINNIRDINNNENEIRYTLIQSIYADKDTGRLFAGGMNKGNSDFGIFYLDDTSAPALRLLVSETEMLSGAASLGGIHYLSTKGRSIYQVAETALSAGPNESDIPRLPESVRRDNEDGTVIYEDAEVNRLFMGMIKFKDQSDASSDRIIVIERNGGTLFEVKESKFRQIRYSDGVTVSNGKYATGALAVWEDVTFDDDGNRIDSDNDGNPIKRKKMFTTGIQGGLYSSTTASSYTHGYAEFDFDYNTDSGWLVFNSRRDTSPSITVHGETDRYSATIGKHPINHMYQVPIEIDDKMIFFASTQTGGLWSYRNRSDGLQWNAEN